ncbi:outer membrane beta-barrel protein [Helicobacter ailurogastricus]|uniref:outer membrane beta-barrel protein n=1 Tax=Helicobacter ailurogastricus TaxID=1578720 RepID=UPI000CF1A4C4|nr:outer membrane beta-barrel protein [Helicobacter ailurogastricus]
MKSKSKSSSKFHLLGTPKRVPFLKTISLALAGCFSLSPVDATEPQVEIYNMVNSIAGLLGGNYQLSNTGATTSSRSPSFGSSAPSTIMGIGSGGTGAGPVNIMDSKYYPIGTASSVNNPQITAYNLYGNGGLFGQLSQTLDGTDGYFDANYQNIYPTAVGGAFGVSKILGQLGSAARNAYNYRAAATGIPSNEDIGNITSATTPATNNPNIPNPYYTVGSKGALNGNLTQSLLSSSASTATANATLTDLYQNIQTVTGYLSINTAGNTINASPGVISAFEGTITTTGGNFLSALASGSTSALSSDLSALNTLLFTAPNATNAIITNSGTAGATQYGYTDGSLEVLSAFNNINTLVSGGLVTATTTDGSTTYSLNTNYANAYVALGTTAKNGSTALQLINQIANNTRNISDLGAVVKELVNLYPTDSSPLPTTAQITDKLNSSLVNPANATNVFTAWKELVGTQTGLKNSPTVLSVLQSALSGGSDPAQALTNALQLSQDAAAINSAFALSALKSGGNANLSGLTSGLGTSITTPSLSSAAQSYIQALQSAFSSNGAYAGLTSALKDLQGLVNTSTFTSNNTQPVTATTSSNQATLTTDKSSVVVSTGNNASATTQYPGTANSGNVNTSWVTQSDNNNAAYQMNLNLALGKLLAGAINYNNLSTTLEGMLSNSTAVGTQQDLLNSITSTGIANVVSNTAYSNSYSSSSWSNNQANVLNELRAISYSKGLLDAYINAITGPGMAGDQLNQAAALSYLDQALSAPNSQAGLIAQTVQAIQSNLNTSVAVPLSVSAMDNLLTQSGIYSGSNPSFLSGVIASGSNNLVSVINDLNTVQNTLADVGSGGKSAWTAYNTTVGPSNVSTMVGNIQTVEKAIVSNLQNGTLSISKTLAGDLKTNSIDANNYSAVAAYVVSQSIVAVATSKALDVNTLLTGWGSSKTAGVAFTDTKGAIAENAIGTAYTTLVANSGTTGSLAWYNGVLDTSIMTANSATAGEVTKLIASATALNNAMSALGTALPSSSNLQALIEGATATDVAAFQNSLGVLTPNQQFGESTISNASQALSALQTKISTIEGQLADWNNVAPGTNPGAPTLQIPLAGMLVNSSTATSAQNLGYASASVNTMQQQLSNVWSTLNDASTLTTANLNNAYSQVSTLSGNIASLYGAGRNFFTDGNLNSTAPSGLSAKDVVIGMGDTNANNYFTNLTNLYTITNLVGSVVNSAKNATSSAYDTVFVAPKAGGNNLLANIATEVGTSGGGSGLYNNLASTADIEQLVQVLLSASSYSSSFVSGTDSSYAPLANALNAAGLSSASTGYTDKMAAGIWTAWQALVGTNGTSGYLGTLNGVISSNNSANAQSLSTAAGIAQLITDAANLQNANNVLAGYYNTTKSAAVAGTVTSSNGSTLSSGNGTFTINAGNGAQFADAVSAANSLGALLKNLSASSTAYLNDPSNSLGTNDNVKTAVTNVVSLINALNSYNHNLGLLTTLTGSTNAGTIASDVVSYLQGNAALKDLTKSGLQTELQTLQQLANRLTYLQDLQTKVQDAMQNNPYALAMQKNAVLTSNSYQNAAGNLFSAINSGGTGLFNTSVAKQYATYNSTSKDYSLDSNYSSLGNLISADATNINAWNSTLDDLSNPSSGLLNTAALSNPTAISNAVSQMGSLSSAAYGIVGYLNGSVSANQSALGAINNVYGSINDTLGGSSPAISNSDFQNKAKSLSATNIFNLSSAAGSTTTLFEGMQAVQALNSSGNGGIVGGLVNAVNVGGKGKTNTFQTLVGSFSTADTGINALIGAVTKALGSNVANGTVNTGKTDLSTGITAINSTVSATDGSTTTAVGAISAIVKALENNATAAAGITAAAADIAAKTTYAGGADVTAAVVSALTPVLGTSGVENFTGKVASTNNTNVAALITAVANLIDGSSSLGTLNGSINGGVTLSDTSPKSVAASIQTALQVALTFYDNATAANQALTSGAVSTLLGNASNTGTLTSAQVAAMGNVVNSVNQVFNADNITTPSSSSAGTLNAVQALVQFVSDSSNTLVAGTVGQTRTLADLMANAINTLVPTAKLTGAITASTFTDALTAGTITPQQLVAAATSVLSNPAALTAINATNGLSFQDNLMNYALEQVFTNAANYAGAIKALTPLLGSSTSTSALSNAAVANATSVKNIANMLNPSNDLAANGKSIAVSSATGTISSGNMASIAKLLGAMTTQNGRVDTLTQELLGTGSLGKTLNSVQQNSAAQAAAISKLGTSGVYTANQISQAVQNYKDALNGADGLIQAQVDLILSNPANSAGALLNNLAATSNTGSLVAQLAALNQSVTGGLNTQVNDVVTGLKNMYNAVATQTHINPNSINSGFSALLGALENLQSQVLNQLATDTTPLAAAAEVRQGGFAMVDGQKVGLQAFDVPNTQNNSPTTANTTTLKSMLTQVNNAIAQVTALQARLKQNPQYAMLLPRSGVAGMPMQTMNSNGNMYGIDVQFGYKQFFGKKKRWGVRYYANFSYQHGTFMTSDASELDNFVYGAGVDALYNFYESKDGKYTSGLFAGLMLEGSSWAVKGQSYYQAMMNAFNATGGHATMNTSYFQIPINIGFRTNVNKHNGFEIGLRIPLATNYYFKGVSAAGQKLDIAYKRNVSVFFNYVYNF